MAIKRNESGETRAEVIDPEGVEQFLNEAEPANPHLLNEVEAKGLVSREQFEALSQMVKDLQAEKLREVAREFKPQLPAEVDTEAMDRKAKEFFDAPNNPFCFYSVCENPPGVVAPHTMTLGLITDVPLPGRTDGARTPGLICEFQEPLNGIGDNLSGKHVVYTDILAHPAIAITKEEAAKFQAHGLPYKEKPGHYSVFEAMQAFRRMTRGEIGPIMNEPTFKAIFREHYAEMRAKREAARRTKLAVSTNTDVDIYMGAELDELVGAGAGA